MPQTLQNEPLKIALLTDADVFAGTERHMLDLARGLRDQGALVSLACPSPSPLADKGQAEGFPVQAIPKQGLVDRNAVRVLRGLLQDGTADIIHAHNGRTALAAALAVAGARRGQCVMTQHFLEPNHATLSGPKAWASRMAHVWMVGQMARILAISQSVRRSMLARNEAPSAKIVVVPNGITVPVVGADADVRAEFGIAPDVPLVVCVARLEQEKDISSLVRAMREVASELPQARCLIAGDGAERDALTALVVKLGLDSVVSLLGFRADAPAVIAAADLFVLPSLAEPFGLVLLEAMALGKAVVATNAGGPVEIVVPDQTGLLSPPGVPHELAQAILRLLRDPAKRLEMGRQGQARFLEHFTAARMAQQTLAVYQRALGRPATSHLDSTPSAAPSSLPHSERF